MKNSVTKRARRTQPLVEEMAKCKEAVKEMTLEKAQRIGRMVRLENGEEAMSKNYGGFI